MNLDFYDEASGVRLNYVEDARTTDSAVSQSARYSSHLDILLRVTADIVDTHSEYEIFRSRGGLSLIQVPVVLESLKRVAASIVLLDV